MADDVQELPADWRRVDVERRSSRTGQSHGLSGVVGDLSVAGKLGPLLPWLQAAQRTGVGRHTVWGQGAFELRYR